MPMLCTLASGSGGNCTLVSDGGTHLLVDAGISARATDRALKALGLCIGDISAVVLTHAHTDHTAGLRVVAARSRAAVYAGPGTARAVGETVRHMETFASEKRFMIGGIGVVAFPTPHDAPESFGFLFEAGAAKAVIATDLGHVPEGVLSYICAADLLLIEANHDTQLLKNGPYPPFLKRRILSDNGHLSNEACAQAVCASVKKGVGRVILGHLSEHNNTPDLALGQVADALGRIGARVGGDVAVEVAPRACAGCAHVF